MPDQPLVTPNITTWHGKFIDYLVNRGLLIALAIFVAYITVGALFYGYYDDFGCIGGINYAISTALTIGWVTELKEKDDWSYLFSTIYLFGGVLMVTGLFIYIAHLERIHPQLWYRKRADDIGRLKYLNTLQEGTWIHTFERMRQFYIEHESPILSWTVLFFYSVL